MDAETTIAALGLNPHPEGGWYAETWRAETAGDARPSGTAIYYLLKAEDRSRWHRVDAAEIWHWYVGGALELSVSEDGRTVRTSILGPALDAGARPQAVVPAGAWQAARPLGAWVLVGCTVSPGFRFEGFEMAPEGWTPNGG